MNRRTNEQGQVIPILALFLIGFIGMMGLAIDVGRLYVARAELSSAVDAATLAGVLEDDVDAAEARATAYMEENLPTVTVAFPATSSDAEFKVKGTRTVGMSFMKAFGFGDVDISAQATAGFGKVKSDSVLILDATSSMGDSPCNGSQSNTGCPIKEAKAAANSFIDKLLAGATGYSKVGFAPYRGCYNPPRLNNSCVPANTIVNLTTNGTALHTGVNNTSAQGGTGTNVCLGLYKAREMFLGPNATAGDTVVKSVVILTDGDNNYNPIVNGQGSPPGDCAPTSLTGSDGTSGCDSAGTRERQLDTKTMALVTNLESMGVEVYVVAFGTCGSSSTTVPTSSYCANIGNSDHDNTADRRLLKCIASSSANTNDHYFEVANATLLPQVFKDIARQIGFRLTE